MPPDTIINAMTIDVEDYFQVSAFAPYIARSEWGRHSDERSSNSDAAFPNPWCEVLPSRP